MLRLPQIQHTGQIAQAQDDVLHILPGQPDSLANRLLIPLQEAAELQKLPPSAGRLQPLLPVFPEVRCRILQRIVENHHVDHMAVCGLHQLPYQAHGRSSGPLEAVQDQDKGALTRAPDRQVEKRPLHAPPLKRDLIQNQVLPPLSPPGFQIGSKNFPMAAVNTALLKRLLQSVFAQLPQIIAQYPRKRHERLLNIFLTVFAEKYFWSVHLSLKLLDFSVGNLNIVVEPYHQTSGLLRISGQLRNALYRLLNAIIHPHSRSLNSFAQPPSGGRPGFAYMLFYFVTSCKADDKYYVSLLYFVTSR